MEDWFYMRLAERMIIAGCVPLLLYIGYRLFDKGARGKMQLTAKAGGRFARLTNLSPGALCFVLATVLGVFILNRGVEIKSGNVSISGLDGNVPRRVSQTVPAENAGQSTVNGALPGLSGTIQVVYAEFGMEVQRLLVRTGRLDREQLQDRLKTIVDAKLKTRATQEGLREIEQLEREVSKGNSDSESVALERLREDYLGEGRQ